MWRTCPHAKAVPGVRVAYADEREIQHALDAGALVIVVPTVDTVEEAIEARNWTYFPPLGRRSNGGGQAFDAGMWGGVPGGYRNTVNDNIVLILMIETLEGLKNADEIAKVPGRDGDLRGQRRPRQLLRVPTGHARLRARGGGGGGGGGRGDGKGEWGGGGGGRGAVFVLLIAGWIAVAVGVHSSGPPKQIPKLFRPQLTIVGRPRPSSPRAVLDTYCVTCHNQRLRTADSRSTVWT